MQAQNQQITKHNHSHISYSTHKQSTSIISSQISSSPSLWAQATPHKIGEKVSKSSFKTHNYQEKQNPTHTHSSYTTYNHQQSPNSQEIRTQREKGGEKRKKEKERKDGKRGERGARKPL